jgi:hypothetical protein
VVVKPVHRRWLDVILRRPPPPEDERERKGREIEALEVKFQATNRVKNRLIEAWRRRQ